MKITGVKVAEDGMSVRIVVENLRQYHLHEIHVWGIKSEEGKGSEFIVSLPIKQNREEK